MFWVITKSYLWLSGAGGFASNTVSLRGELIVFFFTTLCFRNETTMNSEIKGHQK